MLATVASVVLAAMTLEGVSGSGLSVLSELEANNLNLGDPVTLALTFQGSPDFDFEALHPPALAGALEAQTWRVDDAHVKTETVRVLPGQEASAVVGRVFTYSLRPLKEGVIRFPSLAFAYSNTVAAAFQTVVTEELPVRVRASAQVVLDEAEDFSVTLPQPDGLLVDLAASPWHSAEGLTDDEHFAWRKACRAPTAEAFAAFAFPEARLNEAACEILAGNWSRAQKIYSSLEWKIGQTPAIERGIVAALARKAGSPAVELPVWRQVLRPVLRQALWGRLAIVTGSLLLLALVVWGVRRAVRAVAAFALVLALVPQVAQAADPFAEMERIRQLMDQQMQQLAAPGFGASLFGGTSGGGMRMIINGAEERPVEVKARIAVDKAEQTACVPFDLVLELEMPKDCTVTDLRLASSQAVGFALAEGGSLLTDGQTTDPSNVVRRLSVPVRYDVPFKGDVSFEVSGLWTRRTTVDNGRGGSWTSSYSSSFRTKAAPLALNVTLPDEERPADFSGAVGRGFRLTQEADRKTVCTNDVVTLNCRLDYAGYLPPELNLGGRFRADARGRTWVEFRRYFVADGTPVTGALSLSYYDAETRAYRTVECPGVALTYTAEEAQGIESVVVNATDEASHPERLRLRFAPSESAPEIGRIDPRAGGLTVTETSGLWVRVDDGRHAGWVKQEELP